MGLSVDQQEAADAFLTFLTEPNTKEFVIGGHSGTGKTYLTKYLIEAARNQVKLLTLLTGGSNYLTIYCTATTNKAAQVLADKTGEDAVTIHSLLNLRVTFDETTGEQYLVQKDRKTGNVVLHNALIIIDEASMISRALFKLIKAQTKNCKVLYVGDPYQLTPVRETTCPVFTEITKQIKLTTIQRQAKGNPIIDMSHELRASVNEQRLPALYEKAPRIITIDTSDVYSKIDDLLIHDSTDTKILTWSNKQVTKYNNYVRKQLNLPAFFVTGEKVITNSSIVFSRKSHANTDEIVTIDSATQGEHYGVPCTIYSLREFRHSRVYMPDNSNDLKQLMKAVVKKVKDDKYTTSWADFYSIKESFVDLRPVYASTIHKSQGSTYDNVIIDLDDILKNHKINEINRLLYVAITRAANNVILVGGKDV